jgi:hypothetical protein
MIDPIKNASEFDGAADAQTDALPFGSRLNGIAEFVTWW